VMGVRAATAEEISGSPMQAIGQSQEKKSGGCGDPNCCS